MDLKKLSLADDRPLSSEILDPPLCKNTEKKAFNNLLD